MLVVAAAQRLARLQCLAILKTGAAYVPVDPLAPPARNAFIFADCGVRVIIVDAQCAEALNGELSRQGTFRCCR
jgi:non-ribosomal peptide synthetase component F